MRLQNFAIKCSMQQYVEEKPKFLEKTGFKPGEMFDWDYSEESYSNQKIGGLEYIYEGDYCKFVSFIFENGKPSKSVLEKNTFNSFENFYKALENGELDYSKRNSLEYINDFILYTDDIKNVSNLRHIGFKKAFDKIQKEKLVGVNFENHKLIPYYDKKEFDDLVKKRKKEKITFINNIYSFIKDLEENRYLGYYSTEEDLEPKKPTKKEKKNLNEYSIKYLYTEYFTSDKVDTKEEIEELIEEEKKMTGLSFIDYSYSIEKEKIKFEFICMEDVVIEAKTEEEAIEKVMEWKEEADNNFNIEEITLLRSI